MKFVRRIGPITINVNKTRISFQGRVRFAYVYSFRLTDRADLDAEVETWLREACEVGAQRWAARAQNPTSA